MINNQFNFKMHTEIEFGIGSLKKINAHLKAYDVQKAMVITDQGIVKAGIIEKIREELKRENILFLVFDQVEVDPSSDTIEKIAKTAKDENVNVLVAVGGGSAIDAAKGANILLSNRGRLQDYAGVDKVEKKGMPLIAIPTTAGTGSEVTKFAVLTDLQQNIKFSISSTLIAPNLALLDPELTVSLPPSITTATGLDALTHAIEAYTSTRSQPMTNLLALDAIKLIYKYLPIATCNGSNIEARTKLLKAQLFAGIAFNTSFLGLSHAIASPLGAHCHLSHGVANGIMLPHVMRFNTPAAPEMYVEIAQAMGINLNNKNIYDDAYEASTAVEQLAKLCDFPTKLSQVGVKEEILDNIAKDALKSIQLKFNVRNATEKEIRYILQEAF